MELSLRTIGPAAVGVCLACFSIVFIAGHPSLQASPQDDAAVKRRPESRSESEKDATENPVSASNPADKHVQTGSNRREARVRARMLHEAFHGALQVMHRDYFREDQKLKLPAKSLEEVFDEMARNQNVTLAWIAVNTKAMSLKHKPRTDFELAAAKALASGKQEFVSEINGTLHFAGMIRLSAHCLKCHAPGRTSNDDRAAGLIISIPLKPQ